MIEKHFKKKLERPQIGEIWVLKSDLGFYEATDELCLILDEKLVEGFTFLKVLRIKTKRIVWINLEISQLSIKKQLEITSSPMFFCNKK